jgi:hypothetical protein
LSLMFATSPVLTEVADSRVVCFSFCMLLLSGR